MVGRSLTEASCTMAVARMKVRESNFASLWAPLVERVVAVDVDEDIEVERYDEEIKVCQALCCSCDGL